MRTYYSTQLTLTHVRVIRADVVCAEGGHRAPTTCSLLLLHLPPLPFFGFFTSRPPPCSPYPSFPSLLCSCRSGGDSLRSLLPFCLASALPRLRCSRCNHLVRGAVACRDVHIYVGPNRLIGIIMRSKHTNHLSAEQATVRAGVCVCGGVGVGRSEQANASWPVWCLVDTTSVTRRTRKSKREPDRRRRRTHRGEASTGAVCVCVCVNACAGTTPYDGKNYLCARATL